MNKEPLIVAAVAVMAIGVYMFGKDVGVKEERENGQAAQERAAAIDTCAREANVYPESCQMKAVVVTPREEPAPDKAAALLPPPVGSV
jgi:hypothetical protein